MVVMVVEGRPWVGQQAAIPDVVLRQPQRRKLLLEGAPYFDGEPLPKVSGLVKRSIWGWNRGDERVTAQTPRLGHAFDSRRTKGTFFPERWSE